MTYHASLHVDSNYSLVKDIEYFCRRYGKNARDEIYNLIEYFIKNNKEVREEILNTAISKININELVDDYNDLMDEYDEDEDEDDDEDDE
jgi:hypothetical protein